LIPRTPGRVIHPRVFYDEILLPCYRSFRRRPTIEWVCFSAISNSDIMAERMHYFWYYIVFEEPNVPQDAKEEAYEVTPGFLTKKRSVGLRKYREYLVTQCSDFQLIWDVHDAHKHYSLHRENASVHHADQTGRIPMVIQKMQPHHNDAIIQRDEIEAISVVSDSRVIAPARQILGSVMKMWTGELARVGL